VRRLGGSSFGTPFAHYPIQLVGRVSASGQVRVNAVAGPRSAYGTGRFKPIRGSGTWAGTGPSGVCSVALYEGGLARAVESLQTM